jgi:G3E family GTPase
VRAPKRLGSQAMQVRGVKVPISVLTGFLGSGKTTVLNRLVRHPRMARALVIINEFGEIGLDHELVEKAIDDMVLLQSGCLCCTIRSDLIDTLQGMSDRLDRGEIQFDRVVIETTGLADPAPILQGFMTDQMISRRFDIDGVIATVDAVNGSATLDRHIEAVKQVAMADRLLLTKTDIADNARSDIVAKRMAALNPAAPIIRTMPDGTIDPAVLFDVGFYDPTTKLHDVRRWLDEAVYQVIGLDDSQSDDGHGPHRHSHDVNRHDEHIHAVCLVFDDAIPGELFDRWMSSLLCLQGPNLLRFKAIVNLEQLPGPLILHGVQHVIHPPVALKTWPSADRRTRMVFITYDIDESTLRASFARAVCEAG